MDSNDLHVLKPGSFAPPGEAEPRPTGSLPQAVRPAHWWHSQINLLLLVFGLLLLAAVLLVTLLPEPDARLVVEQSTDAVSPTDKDGDAPWQVSQLADARSESQTLLAELLQSKKDLQKKQIENWADEEFQNALAAADQGDVLYKQKAYPQAIEQYQAALDKMNALYNLLPELIETKLVLGHAALIDGKAALAENLFNEVLALDAGNVQAVSGVNRAKTLEDVLAHLAGARGSLEAFKNEDQLTLLKDAQSHLLEAQKLDAQYQVTQTLIDEVSRLSADKNYRLAMSKAYQALFAGRYQTARKAFAQALVHKPADRAASQAMRQALASDKSSSIRTLLQRAQVYETQEQWASAETNYQTVLDRDANQITAKLGLIRAGARLQLERRLQNVIDNAVSFNIESAKQAAQDVLADAQAITQKGPRLNAQIDTLQQALSNANQAIALSFVSDQLTDVSLLRRGARPISLGKFTNKKLSLKPGKYSLTGRRQGYQDVRVDFEVNPARSNQQIHIRCEQSLQAQSVYPRLAVARS